MRRAGVGWRFSEVSKERKTMAVQIVMDRTGDTRHEFDSTDQKALGLAEERFRQLTVRVSTARSRAMCVTNT